MIRCFPLLVLFLIALAPAAAWGDIILGTVDRHVTAVYQSMSDSAANPAAGPFSAMVGVIGDAFADQTSHLQPLALRGRGEVGMSHFDDDDALAESIFDVVFELAAPHSFTLSGLLESMGEQGDLTASFLFIGPSVNVSHMIAFREDTTFMNAGTLEPGAYRLVAFAEMTDVGLGGGLFQFDLQLTPLPQVEPVPEPASIVVWGLAVAVAGAAGWIRRSRRG